MNRFRCLLALSLSLVSTGIADDKPPPPDKTALAGGYSSIEISSEVRKVAEFAVKTQAEVTGRPLRLVKILKVERQVVAGLNFRLELEVADGSKTFNARAVVWKKLDGSLSLSSCK